MPISATLPSYTLNGVPVGVPATASVMVGLAPFQDRDQLQHLRSQYRGQVFFKRDLDQVLSVALTAGNNPIGVAHEIRQLAKQPGLVAPLVQEALIRHFHAHGRTIWGYQPLRLVTDRPQDRLLQSSVPLGVQLPDWLEQRVGYVFDTRTVYPEGRAPVILLACDVKTSNHITAPCSTLLEAGLVLTGRYVQVYLPATDARLSPKPRLVGRVVGREGEWLLLEDHIAGMARVSASEAHLEPRLENLAWCVRELAPRAAADILARLDEAAARLARGPARFDRVGAMFVHLRGQRLEIVPGVELDLGELVATATTTWFPRVEVVKKPALVFDPSGGRTELMATRGLDKHGPYDRAYFPRKQPRIAVVCQAEHKGQVEQFLHKFLEGSPEVTTGRGFKPYEHGFNRRYDLDGARIGFFPTADASAAAYRDASRQAVHAATKRDVRWDLAFVVIDDATHLLHGGEDPYLVTKALFMKRDIPVQEMTIEKIRTPLSDLVWIMSDVGLAMYAKLGGTPWLLQADQTIAHELVMGLGSCQLAGSRLGERERYVGITTVFTGDGTYLLESSTMATPIGNLADALLTTLRSAINTVRDDQQWRATDTVRLVFHAFKPFKDVEVAAVDRLMRSLDLPNIEYAFIHLADDHPFLLFDENNPGAGFGAGPKKGVFAPIRGTLVRLNRDEALLSFTGAQELKQASDGMPRPALLKLHRNSTFKDLTYLARQAFAFSAHSWRGFSPAPLPITILYSRLVAKLLQRLDGVEDWDAEAMLGRIGRTRWFL